MVDIDIDTVDSVDSGERNTFLNRDSEASRTKYKSRVSLCSLKLLE